MIEIVNLIKLGDTKSVLTNFLQSTLREIMYSVNADGGSLFIFDPEQKELVLDSFYNSQKINIKGLRQRLGDGVSGKVAELKKPVLVGNIKSDRRFSSNGYQHYRTNSFMSIPLEPPSGLLGIINIVDKSNGKPFSEKDLTFAIAISKYACLNVEFFFHAAKLSSEKETLSKQKLLLEKYASVGKLAAEVVHEINNPLDGIIRFTNMLLEQMDSHTITKDYLVEIKKGLTRINNITSSLLEFSHQLNSCSFQFKKYSNIHKLIEEALDIFKNKNGARITVNKQLCEGVPFMLDFGLQHVVMNIIKNAYEAMGPSGTLEIATAINDSSIEVTFQDSGHGIPEEILERIFEPFFTTKIKEKGTGLGLAMCREIIGKYEGGSIKVKSREGEGSSFSILIPLKYSQNA